MFREQMINFLQTTVVFLLLTNAASVVVAAYAVRIAKALAAGDAHKYDSAAAWLRAHGINDKATQRTARQVLRDAGMGVGRGRRYSGQVGTQARKAAQANAKRAKGSKAQA